MGYMCHHAIVVTGCVDGAAKKAREEALKIFDHVSEIMPGMNGYETFLIPPDGSKEWWPDSDRGDENRNTYIEWLSKSSGGMDWAEIQYGDENGDQRVVRASRLEKM